MRQYTQLVSQDKVNLLLGPFASNFALADSAVSEKYRVPMVQGGGASDQIFSRKFKYIFGTLAPASNYFASTIDMLKQLEPAPKSVALLYADDAFDVSVAQGTRPLLQKAGLKIAIDARYSSNASDFNSLLSQIKSVNADAIAKHNAAVTGYQHDDATRQGILKANGLPDGSPKDAVNLNNLDDWYEFHQAVLK